jgi:hypothetical protein
MNKDKSVEKVLFGRGKKRKDHWITASINVSELQKYSYEYNGKHYVNVNINVAEQPDQYGKDVTITWNDYKPN